MSVMQGFPPAAADQADLSNWRTRPYCAWAFHHVREIVPSADIPNDPDDVWRLETGEIGVAPDDLAPLIDALDVDAVAVIHKGRLVLETYRNGMGPQTPHILMSVSKSMLGLVAGTLVARGELAEDDLVTKFIPELADSAYAGATIRNLLDMRAGVLFEEDYLLTEGPIVDYRYAANWNVTPVGREAGDLRSFMSKLTEGDGPHGGRFHYVSPNTDLLAWIFERASGMRYADLMSERLWKPLGAETPGYITVDRKGGARAAGGVCYTARDLARVGAMIAAGGWREGREVIPESWIKDIMTAGDASAWDEGDFGDRYQDREMHYRSKWYVIRGAEPLVYGAGIHGQHVFIDPTRDLSIAWFSSRHAPTDDTSFHEIMKGVEMIREAL